MMDETTLRSDLGYAASYPEVGAGQAFATIADALLDARGHLGDHSSALARMDAEIRALKQEIELLRRGITGAGVIA